MKHEVEEDTFPELLPSGGGGCEFDVRQLSAAVADFAYAPGDRCAVYDELEEQPDEGKDSGDSESDEDGDGGDDDGCYVRGDEMRGDAGADAERATPATKHNPDRDNLKVRKLFAISSHPQPNVLQSHTNLLNNV